MKVALVYKKTKNGELHPQLMRVYLDTWAASEVVKKLNEGDGSNNYVIEIRKVIT